jgi:hypothetical protein
MIIGMEKIKDFIADKFKKRNMVEARIVRWIITIMLFAISAVCIIGILEITQ